MTYKSAAGTNEGSSENYDVVSQPGRQSFGRYYSEEHKQLARMMTRKICTQNG